MAQLVKFLLSQHKNPKSTFKKELGMVVQADNPAADEVGTNGSLELTSSWFTLFDKLQVNQKPNKTK